MNYKVFYSCDGDIIHDELCQSHSDAKVAATSWIKSHCGGDGIHNSIIEFIGEAKRGPQAA